MGEELTARGMASAVAMHAEEVQLEGSGKPRYRNRHAHVSSAFRVAGPGGFGAKDREWNRIETLTGWREAWARMSNEALAAAKVERRVDHRSHAVRRVELLRHAEEMEKADRGRDARASRIEAEVLDHPPLPHLPRDAFEAMRAGAGAEHPAFGEAIGTRLEAERLKREAAARARTMAWDWAAALGVELETLEAEAAAEAGVEDRARDEERARVDQAIEELDEQELQWAHDVEVSKEFEIDRAWASSEGRVWGPG